MKSNDLPLLLKYLGEKRVKLNDLIETALELFVPHSRVETSNKAT